ncbi:MAG: bioC [Hyphomonadaceae bacterium]|nr:MAG: bioC [Hyphomonadaceae bacterium]KAF0182683.1 MAG: bioC [Hyphomonadaceae bacterium]
MNGWEDSADAWEHGDRGRQFILDPALNKLLEGRGFKNALDVGCGEGRMCRFLQRFGTKTTGIDPTSKLLERARDLDSNGHYVEGFAEKLPFGNSEFDLVLSCMSLIDIPDYHNAIKEMVRVLKPNGNLVIANLTAMNTAGNGLGWQFGDDGKTKYYALDNYMAERSGWENWRGIRIKNHHRPLSAYMQVFIEAGLTLRHFEEPIPIGGPAQWAAHYARMPWYLIMEWQRP